MFVRPLLRSARAVVIVAKSRAAGPGGFYDAVSRLLVFLVAWSKHMLVGSSSADTAPESYTPLTQQPIITHVITRKRCDVKFRVY